MALKGLALELQLFHHQSVQKRIPGITLRTLKVPLCALVHLSPPAVMIPRSSLLCSYSFQFVTIPFLGYSISLSFHFWSFHFLVVQFFGHYIQS